jgi:hypothetical protein
LPLQPPDHWEEFAGPANWFRLWHPPGWTLTQDGAITSVTAPDGEALLMLHAAWSREATATPLEQLLPVDAFFPSARNVRDLPPLDIDAECIGRQGEANMATAQQWWLRPFKQGDWRQWKLWVLRHAPVMIVVSLLHSADYDAELDAIAAMMLRTLKFADVPADPPEEFARRVLALARQKFPLLEAETAADFQLKLGESNVNLFNFYRSYLKVPEKFEEIMLPALTTVVQIQGWGSEQSDPPLENIRDRIMPMLYPEEVWKEQFPNFVGQPWVGRLMVLYVVDESHAYWYIRAEQLDKWGISADELHDIALENLDDYFDRSPMELAVAGGEGGPTLVMPTGPDSYNAARLLSETFRSKLREVIEGTYAVGVPGRDFFVAVGLEPAEMLEHVRQKVRDDYAQMDHPLSRELLLVSPDGVSGFAGEDAPGE